MSFTEKMQVWTLVLDYLKVVLGYPVTIPVLVLTLCILFRERIRAVLDALEELTYPGGSVKLRERTAVQKFNENIVEAKQATAYATVQLLPPQPPPDKSIEAIASFFDLVARLLPLIPMAERHRFIVQSTGTLPEEYNVFREALGKLAAEAPEVHALNARDVIVAPVTPVTGGVRLGGEQADTPLPLRDDAARRKLPGSDYRA